MDVLADQSQCNRLDDVIKKNLAREGMGDLTSCLANIAAAVYQCELPQTCAHMLQGMETLVAQVTNAADDVARRDAIRTTMGSGHLYLELRCDPEGLVHYMEQIGQSGRLIRDK